MSVATRLAEVSCLAPAIAHPPIARRAFRAIGTDAIVAVVGPDVADAAAGMLQSQLRVLDEACSRFRSDAEISALADRSGEWVPVSGVLYDTLETACAVARLTGGAVDPTVGEAMERLGYDRDFSLLGQGTEDAGRTDSVGPLPAPGSWVIDLDPRTRRARIPGGVRLDLGSSAKAMAADWAADQISSRLGTGVLVSLGGDVAVRGPAPSGGWPVGVAERSSATSEDVDQVVSLYRGAIASSSPGARTWQRGGALRHHIVDPLTGQCARTCWRLVSVIAPTCVEANALSTASVVWGFDAVERLRGYGHPARLVRDDGMVVDMNGWPSAMPAQTVPSAVGDRSGSGTAR